MNVLLQARREGGVSLPPNALHLCVPSTRVDSTTHAAMSGIARRTETKKKKQPAPE